MINETQHLLICLAEECAEVQQRITKILRFGLYEVEPNQSVNNLVRLRLELIDLLGVLELIEEGSIGELTFSRQDIEKKKAKVKNFMEYAREQGELD